ncbi:Hint domain-containing protein [Thioclava sp. DLFJ5-1]|uniref:Hint domain-containing protein n=1 Tax=Thioclava sp. DLFJ5-1 TaxID=1915314 RepID=UPI00143927AF|nr:Hint domain-containing protein [Thioclava sp. DLFJ5-1]
MTRRYAAWWLEANGFIEETSRVAPAIPLFEEAFSALARGAVIATEEGPISVEDLVPGMRVLTADERVETITWKGSMTMFPAAKDVAARMIRVTAEAFGHGRPSQDLVLGPHARICLRDARLRGRLGIEAAYAPIAAFVDGVSVIEVTPISPVSAYHLVLEQHGSLKVGGMEVESFHPGEGFERMIDPRMAELFLALFPQMDKLREFGPIAAPRLTRFEVEEMLI